jgi:hypothetical protein
MRGRVLELSGNTVIIEPDRPAQCFGCLQSECKKGFAPVQAEREGTMDLAPGQLVETGGNGKTLFAQALGAFLPLPVGFITGYLGTALLFPATGEGPRAAAGALLLFVAAAGFYVFRRRFPPKALPRILRIL